MKNRILAELNIIEQEHEVDILYAVQAGSRAWGFESPASDFDIRFIYKHPLNWYLSLDQKRDVIEWQSGKELELSGWDLKKAMLLLKKSNPTLLEWLQTEDRLIEDKYFCEKVFPLQELVFSPSACYHHYLNMTKTNWNKWQRDSMKSVKLTLHVLRGLLCCLWIKEKETFPPVSFNVLFYQCVPDLKLKEEIQRLVELKKRGAETIETNLVILSSFIEVQIRQLSENTQHFKKSPTLSSEAVNRAFRELVKNEN
ncbi:nucleotidyltransferase domain-containing protein [Rossellomorea vietnamensis]|uniref:Nucleotidyltransferase domain-containing protein n=1 Tax=Rossellomorea vietnamensis TaxID=218284 RepID=A0A5D4MKD9_9BACI|nr:nucleotidyltransferase domain-containing protein [Rossellomorea vietnamensis]TYS01456.1 nucleotidyltransferase domain-containing protein [Rossellomorea vietnamensis]